jgi:hypothetical protein
MAGQPGDGIEVGDIVGLAAQAVVVSYRQGKGVFTMAKDAPDRSIMDPFTADGVNCYASF